METTNIISNKDKFITLTESQSSVLGNIAPIIYENAKADLLVMEIPTTRHEEWKYTRTAKLAQENWKFSEAKSALPKGGFVIDNLDASRIVFINGKWDESQSDIKTEPGVTLFSKESLTSDFLDNIAINASANFFEAFQKVTCSDAIGIHVSKNTLAEKPIHIVHYCDDENALSTPSIFVHLEKSASIDITESFHGNAESKSLTIRGLFAQVDENARLEYTKIQAENDNQFTIHSDNLRVESNGFSNFNTLTIDGGWVRNDLRIDLNGQNIESHLSGFYLPRKKQMVDNHTKVDHRFAHCESNELYKGILFDQSSGVFNGKVFVHKDAQKTNAYQNNANILASDDAQMNTKPELEIYADDVKCSHGTTTGQIDEAAMFYLRARGMSEDSARKLLTTAFINDVIEKVANKAVKAHVLDALSNKGLLYI